MIHFAFLVVSLRGFTDLSIFCRSEALSAFLSIPSEASLLRILEDKSVGVLSLVTFALSALLAPFASLLQVGSKCLTESHVFEDACLGSISLEAKGLVLVPNQLQKSL